MPASPLWPPTALSHLARWRGSPAPLALAVLASLASCLPGAPRPPEAPLRGRLVPTSPVQPAAVPGASGPLRVAFATPQGETTHATEVSLVFSKPMRPLGLGPHEPPPPVQMTPDVPGRWQWLGSSALRFNPSAPWPAATPYRVEVPAGIRALDGDPLRDPFVLSFSTPRPALGASRPEQGARQIAADAIISLHFTQPVTRDEVRRATTLRVAGAEPLAFDVEDVQPTPQGDADPTRYRLVPRKPMPLGAEIRVHLDASLRGNDGPLPLGEDVTVAFRTADPFAVVTWQCAPHPTTAGVCDPNSDSVTLTLTNPASIAQVTRALVAEPAQPLDVYPMDQENDAASTYEITPRTSPGPGGAITLRLRARPGGRALLDIHGQRLPSDATADLRFGDLASSVAFDVGGTYWGTSTSRRLPIETLNATDVVVTAAPLAEQNVLAWLADAERRVPVRDPELHFAVPSAGRNEPLVSATTFEHLLGVSRASPLLGPVVARARWTASDVTGPQQRERIFQFTDLGAIARAGQEGTALWLTRLSTGAPVSGATVQAFAIRRGAPPPLHPLTTATTDARGLAWLPFDPQPSTSRAGTLALVVRHQDDWIFQSLDTPPPPAPIGTLFDARGIYRPGEQLFLKGLVRLPTAAGLTSPRGRVVDLALHGPGRDDIASWKIPLSAHGTFHVQHTLREDAPLGRYRAEVTLDGAHIDSASFRVDEYRPAEATPHADLDADHYRRGDTAVCNAAGRFLHGGPMAGATALVFLSRARGSHVIPGLDGYSVSDRDVVVAEGSLAATRTKLDASGAFRFPVQLTLPGQTTTESIQCHVEIVDHNRQSYEAFTAATVHPADVYVALALPEGRAFHPGVSFTQRVLVVTPEGARRSRPVRLEFIHRKPGRTPEDTTLTHCDLTPGLEPASCKLTPPSVQPGEDDTLLVRATVQDERGHVHVASHASSFEPLPPPPKPAPPTPPPAPSPPPSPQLAIHVGHEQRAGTTARLSLTSSFSVPTQALLTVEREGVLARHLLTLPPHQAGPLAFDLPITEVMIPNVVLHLVAVSEARSEVTNAHLSIDPAPRLLQVALRPSCTRCAPGDRIDLDVEVHDAAGRPVPRAEVTLWGADEASLQIARYSLPRPELHFFAERRHRVQGADVRKDLVTFHRGYRSKAPSIRQGSVALNGPRGDFRQTVLFEPALLTDAAGRVRKRVQLPDGLTEYRFMAVAVAEDDRVGTVQTSLTTSKPLMARATLPRVIRVGDTLEASVVVSTQDLPRADIIVSAHAQGLTPLGPPRRAAVVDPGLSQELRFPFRADRPGRARLTVDAAASALLLTPDASGTPLAPSIAGRRRATDAMQLSLPVVAPTVLETAALHGDTASAIAEQLGALDGLRDDLGGLTLVLSSTPLAGLAPGIEQLLEYPYGCTEQTVSRMIPLLALRDLARGLGIALPEGKLGEPGAPSPPTGALATALTEAVARVIGNQRHDGGYGYWPGSTRSDLWLTAYTRFALGDARRRGVPVPLRALDGATRHLQDWLLARSSEHPAAPTAEQTPKNAPHPAKRTLQDLDARRLDDDDLAIAALLADTLAAEGTPEPTLTRALFAVRDRLTPFARFLLLHAVATAGGDQVARDELTRDLEAAARIDGALARIVSGSSSHSEALLGSDVRTTAAALRALAVAAPQHPLLHRLARAVLADRQHGRWRSTHEAAWALLGLDAYRKAHPPPTAPLSGRAFLGDTLLSEASFGAPPLALTAKATLPMDRLLPGAGASLVFAAEGDGLLFYEATLRFARRALPTTPVEAGLFVQKTFRNVAASSSPGVTAAERPSFRAGDVVLCVVEIVTPSPRHGVLLEDPLPGGLEPINPHLGSMGSRHHHLAHDGADHRELRDDRVVWVVDTLPAGIHHFSYLARAITPGTFVTPPTRAEAMYAPDTFGSTAAGMVEVLAPIP
ncbi:Ig-like domain-containing alpha-2-macroglobulin family protein [Chondromyces crocatus]|uniref:Alpha-2-macroglobulin domain-containing protein n=1 Tax=Chondromyces crocatus TaxID=52 RepID=A0A0K1EAA6_CHOCO|nr:Ig-like domain-containing alpha-2-macroglobulin family protein [Chondromyces crocatus]AKT37597.1 uncharacterized protein CMC5_017380 [Chondromyces crocatus]